MAILQICLTASRSCLQGERQGCSPSDAAWTDEVISLIPECAERPKTIRRATTRHQIGSADFVNVNSSLARTRTGMTINMNNVSVFLQALLRTSERY